MISFNTENPLYYGKLVYSNGISSDITVFIVPIERRHPIDRTMPNHVRRVQVEAYRLAECIADSLDIGIILAERHTSDLGMALPPSVSPTDDDLHKILKTSSNMEIAEILMSRRGMILYDMEDDAIFSAYCDIRKKFLLYGENFNSMLPIIYLRCADFLLKVPKIMEKSHQDGSIKSKSAVMFLSGMNYAEIISMIYLGWINKRNIPIGSSESDSIDRLLSLESLGSLKQALDDGYKIDYSITALKPNSLRIARSTDYFI